MKKFFVWFLIVVFIVSFGFVISDALNKPKVDVKINFQPTIEDVVEDVIGSVVHIVNEDGGWQGSGILIKPGLILTARHVVENSDSFTITTNDGHKLRATRTISRKKNDLAFIKIDDFRCINPKYYDHSVPICFAKLGSIKECRLGQTVFAIGSPYGKENFNSVTLGIISGLNRNWDSVDPYTGDSYGWEVSFTTDAAGHPGNSGCPVFTLDGKVRGILVGGYSPVLINCMPVDLVLDDIEEIELMFIQDEYELEEEAIYDAYNPYIDGVK